MARVNKMKHELISEIVAENGGSFEETQAIVENQFKFLKKHMEHGAFSTVRLPYLGKFYVKPGRLSRLNHAVISRRKL